MRPNWVKTAPGKILILDSPSQFKTNNVVAISALTFVSGVASPNT
jgi:hypothetical protein